MTGFQNDPRYAVGREAALELLDKKAPALKMPLLKAEPAGDGVRDGRWVRLLR